MSVPGSGVVLGTAQLGGLYGVANRSGVPDAASARALIEAAWEAGITTFDTAAAYGGSEAALGRALRELGIADEAVVITKVRPLSPEEAASASSSRAAIRASVTRSSELLGLPRIPVLMMHREVDAQRVDLAAELVAEGLCDHVGVSTSNEPGPAAEFAKNPCIDALQVPLNVLDPRHRVAGTFSASAEHDVTVFVRSVFLQGLLLMPERNIHPLLRGIVPARRALQAVADDTGLSLAQLALRYVLTQPGDVRVVIGAEAPEQIRENLELYGTGEGLAPETMAAVADAVGDLPHFLITPNDWTGKIPPGWAPGDPLTPTTAVNGTPKERC